ncbi:olfactory receptor 51A4-like [Ambystoma mexicanum]|uniref:olfactory receptor 51A4-like n=1 Tax=Ambystoma mexicanum TaxID=8296 RepID=UPI0037E9B565
MNEANAYKDIMSAWNSSGHHHSIFILTGLAEQDPANLWITTLICVLYTIIILGNGSILFVIKSEQSLHAPMYYLLSVLAVTDLALSLTTLPTMLKVFLFNSREIHIDACLSQVYFMNLFTIMESGALLAMALDRFIAICDPLRYVSIFSNSTVARIGWSISLRAIMLILPEPFLDRWLPFCKTNILAHPWCLHQEIIKLACTDVTVQSYYGLFIVATLITDLVLILVSYILILREVLRIASQKERSRTLSTCMSHIWAVFLFYMPTVCLSVLLRLSHLAPPPTQKVLAYIFYLVPPLLNPIIYCIKTKQIRVQVVANVILEDSTVLQEGALGGRPEQAVILHVDGSVRKGPWVPVLVDDHPVDMLVDSGSPYTLVAPEVYQGVLGKQISALLASDIKPYAYGQLWANCDQWDNITDFVIGDRTESDHYPLSAVIRISPELGPQRVM